MRTQVFTTCILLATASFSAHGAEQVTNYAKSSGFNSCLSTVSEIEKFFADGSNYGSWSTVAKDKSDQQPLNATLELTYSDGSQLIDFTIIPSKDGTCSYTYTRTWYSPKNCIATSKDEYMSKAKYVTEINKNVTAFEDPNGAKLLLSPAGSGCIVQKKEIGFRHRKQDS